MDLDSDIHNIGNRTDVDTTQEFHLLPILAVESLQCGSTAVNSISWTKRKRILTKVSPLPILKLGSAGKKIKDIVFWGFRSSAWTVRTISTGFLMIFNPGSLLL